MFNLALTLWNLGFCIIEGGLRTPPGKRKVADGMDG